MLKSASLISALVLTLASATAGFSQDAEAGAKVFKKCKACHQIGEDAKNGAGPQLNDVIGRTAGTAEGFKYGNHLVEAGENGLVWTEALLADYITDPKAFLRAYLDNPKAKAKMTLKLKKEQDRLDVVAYLATASTMAAAEPEVPVETRSVQEVIDDQEFTEAFMSDPANVAAGKELWFSQCTHCHGYKSYPGKAPKLKPVRYKPTFVFKRVYKGFKKMPQWRDVFTIDEIRLIVTYVKSQGFAP